MTLATYEQTKERGKFGYGGDIKMYVPRGLYSTSALDLQAIKDLRPTDIITIGNFNDKKIENLGLEHRLIGGRNPRDLSYNRIKAPFEQIYRKKEHPIILIHSEDDQLRQMGISAGLILTEQSTPRWEAFKALFNGAKGNGFRETIRTYRPLTRNSLEHKDFNRVYVDPISNYQKMTGQIPNDKK